MIPNNTVINHYLALKGYCSRRKAVDFIKQGKVKINGVIAEIGQRVGPDDVITVTDEISRLPERYRYIAFYKPVGVVSHNPQEGERGVENIFKIKGTPLYPIGRLDKASEGLMLLSNDGRIVDRLLNPKTAHEKEYVVTVDKRMRPTSLRKMASGVRIEGYMTKPAKTREITDRTFSITLTEGKKHQIRRMTAALGYQVRKLRRVRIMNLTLGTLKAGQGRALTEKEKADLLSSLGL